jgi:hypothetical protein
MTEPKKPEKPATPEKPAPPKERPRIDRFGSKGDEIKVDKKTGAVTI